MAEQSTRDNDDDTSLEEKIVAKCFLSYVPEREPFVRDPRMIGLLLTDAVILFADNEFGSRSVRSPLQCAKISEFLGIAGVGKQSYFDSICDTLKASVGGRRLSLEAYANMVRNVVDKKHDDRLRGANYLLGGYDILGSEQRVVYSLWLINKAGAVPITKTSYVVGCEIAESFINTKFNQSFSVEVARNIGWEAIGNKHSGCVIIKKTNKKNPSKASSKGWSKEYDVQW